MLLDDPLDKCLMGMLLLAIVGECEFQRLTSLLHWDFSHFDGAVVVNTVISGNINCVCSFRRGVVEFQIPNYLYYSHVDYSYILHF